MEEQDIIFKHNQYKIYDKIGTGEVSGSIIRRAREVSSLNFVAFKKAPCQTDQSKRAIAHQIKLLTQLQHPNIVRLIDQSIDQSQRWIYLFYELCQEYTLYRIVQTDKYLPVNCALVFAQDLRDLLLYLHAKRLTYNDLHPQNFLSTSNGILKAIEFEHCCSFKQTPLTGEAIEQSVRKCGFLHRAPETLINGGAYSIQADLYSLGQCIYFMLTGQFAF